jgi:hypothetical protein
MRWYLFKPPAFSSVPGLTVELILKEVPHAWLMTTAFSCEVCRLVIAYMNLTFPQIIFEPNSMINVLVKLVTPGLFIFLLVEYMFVSQLQESQIVFTLSL